MFLIELSVCFLAPSYFLGVVWANQGNIGLNWAKLQYGKLITIGEAHYPFQGGAIIYIACSSKLYFVPPK